jgi:hypothetical protein
MGSSVPEPRAGFICPLTAKLRRWYVRALLGAPQATDLPGHLAASRAGADNLGPPVFSS